MLLTRFQLAAQPVTWLGLGKIDGDAIAKRSLGVYCDLFIKIVFKKRSKNEKRGKGVSHVIC
ncbi:hypothetical protein GCM10017764_14680 [Sphingobacterium griseoflavum]|uniref:Uncharacterized protein n=1 Tax=Sphingobacterium griseoflavum TaxID=1474952 RepID=A0ABQ3HWC1_9SPHI|nr:hypothetical protein GCM10017764_14680 [Sphingobacterium griseoflavum]